MARPVLYYDDVSPPVRSCLMLIKMLAIDVEFKYIDLFKGGQFDAHFVQINPVHTVPVLVDGDLTLTDSHVILMHLSEKYDKREQPLWPQSNNERMHVMNRLFFECSILFRRDSELMSNIVRKGYTSVDLPYFERKIHEIYGMMEQFLVQHKYMATDYLTIADISIVTTLTTVALMFPVATDIADRWPLLRDWLQRMSMLPEYSINRNGLEKLRLIMERIGKFRFPTSPPPTNEQHIF